MASGPFELTFSAWRMEEEAYFDESEEDICRVAGMGSLRDDWILGVSSGIGLEWTDTEGTEEGRALY